MSSTDPDGQGLEYRFAHVQDGDLPTLEKLSRRGWRVVVALSPTRVLLSRPEGWSDGDG